MPSDEDWEELDPDMMMRSERKHEWISEPKYKRMFDDIEAVSYTHLTLPTIYSV